MTGTTEDLIARLWARFAPLAVQRVDTLAAHVRHGSTGTGVPTHAQARQAAHDLVGSLGSYGRPRGSELAAALEALLGDGSAPLDPARRAEAVRLVDELEREVRA